MWTGKITLVPIFIHEKKTVCTYLWIYTIYYVNKQRRIKAYVREHTSLCEKWHLTSNYSVFLSPQTVNILFKICLFVCISVCPSVRLSFFAQTLILPLTGYSTFVWHQGRVPCDPDPFDPGWPCSGHGVSQYGVACVYSSFLPSFHSFMTDISKLESRMKYGESCNTGAFSSAGFLTVAYIQQNLDNMTTCGSE